MELDAVSSVIIQKLRDVVAEGAISHNKVIGDKLEEMQKALEKMQGFFTDAASKARNEKPIKEWTDEYLKILYEVEDTIESFVLRITRQRKRMGCLMNHALFLKNFTACKMLSRKLVKLKGQIDTLNQQKPPVVKDASLRSRRSQQNGGQINTNDAVRTDGYGAHEIHAEKTNSFDYAELNNTTQSARHSSNISPITVESPKSSLSINPNVFPGDTSIIPSDHIRPSGDDDDAGFSFRFSRSNSEHHTPMKLHTRGHTENARRRSTSEIPGGSSPKRHIRFPSQVMTLSSNDSFIRERSQHSKLIYNSSFHEQEPPHILGFRQYILGLVKRLTKEDNGDNRIISLVGESGSGKTTLARAVYGNRVIKEHFKSSCAWIAITKASSTKDLLQILINQVGEPKDQDGVLTEEMLKARVLERLGNRKYLIMLDGVWSRDVWENLKRAFPDEKNGSKIILTTCSKQVATHASPESSLHEMNKLDDQNSWKLFLNKVGSEETQECSTLKKKIIQICKGLPLNIVLLGSLLSTKKDECYEKWVEILDEIASNILSYCYNDLDAHSKLCLLYLMLFPQEYDIPVRRLTRLWLAEGFVKRSGEGDKFPEDVAQEYFDNLVKRSLIQISKLRSDGSPRKCRLLGALHDYLLEKARDISLFHVHRNSDCHQEVAASYGRRRLVEYEDAKSCLNRSQFQHLRSYISFNSQKKDIPATGVANLLGNMIGKGSGLLRVLDLEGVYKPSLPDNLGDLFHLRYLGLRWTFLDKLPKSVGNLLYLETLDLKRTYINRIPNSIWKLKHLRHLNLNEISLDKEMPLHPSGSLPPLLTLWGLSIDPESSVNKCLSQLTQLRELGISFRLRNADDHCSRATNDTSNLTRSREDLIDWISKLTTLESLRLRSKNDMGYPSDLILKPLSRLEKLSNLNLLGKLQELPKTNEFPPNVKVLTLSVSQLIEDPMPILGHLQSLTVLRLLANSYHGKKIVCPRGTFPELRVLNLWVLEYLEEWELEEEAMKKLKELNIRRCSNLNTIPSRLLQRETFKDLILTNMPPKFKEDVEKKNFKKVSITVKDYNFAPLPCKPEDVYANGVASNVNGYSVKLTAILNTAVNLL